MEAGNVILKDIWRDAVDEHCRNKGVAFRNPKVGTPDYNAVKKIYNGYIKKYKEIRDKSELDNMVARSTNPKRKKK